jgi:hypothetical protein
MLAFQTDRTTRDVFCGLGCTEQQRWDDCPSAHGYTQAIGKPDETRFFGTYNPRRATCCVALLCPSLSHRSSRDRTQHIYNYCINIIIFKLHLPASVDTAVTVEKT